MGVRLTTQQLREAAEVATATGTTIVIEAAGKVYKIAPGVDSFPLTTTEKDRAACDKAFGVSG